MKRPPPQPCPTPHKRAHRTRADAHGHCRATAIRTVAEGNHFDPRYSYLCVCGRFHTTRWASYQGVPNHLEVAVPDELQAWARPPVATAETRAPGQELSTR